MPERSFRVIIENASSFLTLNQSFNHLCGGVYTGGWLPPGSIAPGTSGGIQSESDGFATGTEAYVKYDVDGPDGKHGMIYIYWDNPFWGYTHFRFASAQDDIAPDCDYSAAAGGSVFGNGSTPLDFTLSLAAYKHGVNAGGDITQIGDLTVFAAGPAGGFADLLGVLGIDKNPELDLVFSDAVDAPPVSTPELFGQAKPPTVQLLTQATPEDWTGQWISENGIISVDIHLDGSVLLVNVYDGTADPPISISNEAFVPGPVALLDRASPAIQLLINDQVEDPKQRLAYTRAVKNIIAAAIDSPLRASAASSRFQALVGKAKTSTPLAVAQAQARIVGRSIGFLLENQGGAAYLSDHVVLMLFGRFQSNKQVGTQLLYQRVNVANQPIFSQVLAPGAPLQ
jgi:hypothetical protein